MVCGMPIGVLEGSNVGGLLKEAVYDFSDISTEKRYLSSIGSLSNCTILHSVFRRECLQGLEFRKTIGLDHVLISRLLWFGKLHYMKNEKYFRRYFKERGESQAERILGYDALLSEKDFFNYYVEDLKGLYVNHGDEVSMSLEGMIDNTLQQLCKKYGSHDFL
jgi:hypothetical protein